MVRTQDPFCPKVNFDDVLLVLTRNSKAVVRLYNFVSATHCLISAFSSKKKPGDFITNVKQINNQSDLISMSNFAGPFYLTIRSSVCMILFKILVLSVFTTSAKLDPVTYF